jgi:molybdopterin-guanine dinucleotide biosynthesis protein
MLPYFSDLDLVLTEGFKKNEKPKIEVYNSKNPEKPLCILGEANNVFALVSDKVIPACEDLLTLTPDKITEIADLIEFRIGKNQKKGAHI